VAELDFVAGDISFREKLARGDDHMGSKTSNQRKSMKIAGGLRRPSCACPPLTVRGAPSRRSPSPSPLASQKLGVVGDENEKTKQKSAHHRKLAFLCSLLNDARLPSLLAVHKSSQWSSETIMKKTK
jgi:hypothetical protein